ncbi:MAG TPA: flippase [Chitinophagaceae bacterium]|nr:flippase [Chitinophagaceae bacterium]
MGMTTKVIKGSFWVMLGQFMPMIASFIATPFVIRFLGSESYGVLILVSLIMTYFSFADFGMGLASTKYGSEAYGNHDPGKEAEIIKTASVIAFFSGLAIALPVFLFSDWIVSSLLKAPEHLRYQASIALKITSGSFFLGLISGVYNTPQLSRLKMNLSVLINSGTKILMILVTPLVLYFGGGIIEATLVALIAAAVILAGNLIVSGKLLHGLYAASFNRKYVKPLLRFGAGTVLYGGAAILILNFEKVILARLTSPRELGYYSIAFTLANMTTMFTLAIGQTLIPAFSQLLGPGNKEHLNALFSRTFRGCLMTAPPIIMVLIVIAKPFFTIWAGEEFGRESIYPFYILMLGIFFSLIMFIPNSILLAFGKTSLFAKVYWIEMIPYAGLAWILISRFGIPGAAMAWSIREIFNSYIFFRFSRKYAGISYSIRDHADKYFLTFLILVPPVLFALLVNNFSGWLFIIVPASLFTYLFLAWKFLVQAEERQWVTGKINGLLGYLRIKNRNDLGKLKM